MRKTLCLKSKKCWLREESMSYGNYNIFLRHNDSGKPLSKMGTKELEKLDSLSPYGETQYHAGWSVPFELHNGNIYTLVFWKGKLMKIEDTPKVLDKKYYDKDRGKKLNKYEWTILKRYLLAEIERLDKKFKKSLRKNKACVKMNKEWDSRTWEKILKKDARKKNK